MAKAVLIQSEENVLRFRRIVLLFHLCIGQYISGFSILEQLFCGCLIITRTKFCVVKWCAINDLIDFVEAVIDLLSIFASEPRENC